MQVVSSASSTCSSSLPESLGHLHLGHWPRYLLCPPPGPGQSHPTTFRLLAHDSPSDAPRKSTCHLVFGRRHKTGCKAWRSCTGCQIANPQRICAGRELSCSSGRESRVRVSNQSESHIDNMVRRRAREPQGLKCLDPQPTIRPSKHPRPHLVPSTSAISPQMPPAR